MLPRTNRWKQLANARAAIDTNHKDGIDSKIDNETPKSTKIAPKQMAVACLLSETNPTKFRDASNLCNLKTCAMSTYFLAQKEVIPAVIDVANRTVEFASTDGC